MKKWTATLIALFFSTQSLQASSGVKGNRTDYIIVGVGTAGGLLAKKLTDDKKTSVIALHSGQDLTGTFILKYGKNTIFSVGATLLGTQLDPEVQEIFQDFIDLSSLSGNAAPLYEAGATVPQICASGDDLLWVISSPLGGGSGVNAGAWCWGTSQVYSQWEAIGGPEWSPTRIFKTYKKLEDYRGKTTNSSARGKDGPLEVIQNEKSKLANVFTEAMIQAAGVPYALDYNDPNFPYGASNQFQLTRSGDNGYYRVSSATAFLHDGIVDDRGKGVHGRKLKIKFGSTGLRVIWNGNTAIGVEYTQNNEIKQVFADKGVIVCAGLRSSPFLLSSGVGPSSLLNALDIPVVYDNPNVGQGLADQPHVILLFSSNPQDSASNGNTPFSFLSWLPDPRGSRPGRQLRLSTADLVPGFTVGLFDLVQPLSRGTVSINSANPLVPPVIDFGLLCNSDDLDLYVAGFQTYIKNLNQQLQSIDPSYQLLVPDPSLLDPGNVALLEAYIKDAAEANMHFQSHCQMGTVVDSHGRVFGVNNLYVADNSINPLVMDGSPMASGYLVAAQIARLLGY